MKVSVTSRVKECHGASIMEYVISITLMVIVCFLAVGTIGSALRDPLYITGLELEGGGSLGTSTRTAD